jgi:hypothetical protein
LFNNENISVDFAKLSQVYHGWYQRGSMLLSNLQPQIWSMALLLAILAMQLGCRNAAYTDLYAENMAAEIRDLEDQIYEYDDALYELEQELEAAKEENRRLQNEALNKGSQRSNTSPPASVNNGPILEFQPRDFVPGPLPSRADASPGRTSSTPQTTPAESILESKNGGADSSRQRLGESLEELPRPDKAGRAPEEELDIPSIDPGTPMPPEMPVLKDFSSQNRSSPDNALELNVSRIEIPGQLASSQLDQNRSVQGQLKIGFEKPTDMRITEISFHPVLCRGANLDDESDDDGLYLVLQPKNEKGELVPTFANLEVTVIDPARHGQAAQIGHWKYSSSEVKSKFKPTGSDQGIHMMLPWNGPDPSADRVIVFAYYTLTDGRQVVNDKHIFVSGKGSNKTVWVPRVPTDNPVITASGQEPVSSSAKNVVRPAVGRGEPAPYPIQR